MSNVYLIRHAEKTEDGEHITPDGRRMAQLLAKKLKHYAIGGIICGNLQRQIDTADEINRTLKLPIEYIPELVEIESYMRREPKKYPRVMAKVRKAYEKIMSQEIDPLVVSSGIINRVLIAFALRIPPERSEHIQYFTGLTHINKGEDGRIRLGCVNDTGHLPYR